MARQERSRSPAGQSEWISRQVATLARYTHKRPQGLWVDPTGAFRLSVLMGSWAQQHQLSKQDVVSALQKHRFHDCSTTLRFAMSAMPNGDMTIRVHRRKDGVKDATPSPVATPAIVGASPTMLRLVGAQAAASAGGGIVKPRLVSPRPHPNAPGDNGGLRPARFAVAPGAAVPAARTVRPPGPPLVNARQQPGPVATPQQKWRSEEKSPWDRSKWQGAGPWQRAGSAGNKGTAWKGGEASWDGRAEAWQAGDAWKKISRGEKVQRWLSYALKNGHADLGITIEDGWMSIEEVAEALGRSRPDLGVADGKQLRELLTETDAQGRFELDTQGRLRKVQRELRQPRLAGKDKIREVLDRADAACKAAAANGAQAPSEDAPERPPPPPGKPWVKYVDDGILWWFYDGPLGKWWMQEVDEEPQPWEDED